MYGNDAETADLFRCYRCNVPMARDDGLIGTVRPLAKRDYIMVMLCLDCIKPLPEAT